MLLAFVFDLRLTLRGASIDADDIEVDVNDETDALCLVIADELSLDLMFLFNDVAFEHFLDDLDGEVSQHNNLKG